MRWRAGTTGQGVLSGHFAISCRAMAARSVTRSAAYCLEYPRFNALRSVAWSAPSLLITERAAPYRATISDQNSKERKRFAPSRIRNRLASTPASTVNRRCSMRMPKTGPSSMYCDVRNPRMSLAMLKALPTNGRPRAMGSVEEAILPSFRLRSRKFRRAIRGGL